MSLHDRRAANYKINSGPRPRVSSSRAGEAEKPSRLRGNNSDSPLASDNMEHLRGSTSSAKGLHREFSSASDRRTERTTVTTREKMQIRTRNPVKESTNAGNRGDPEKQRVKKGSHGESGTPQMRQKENESLEGILLRLLKSERSRREYGADLKQNHGILKRH